MYYLKENCTGKIEVKGSKFIAVLIRIDDPNKLKEELNKVKDLYPNATHYCYGMQCGQTTRSNDDSEPSGTAGIPILEVLKRNQIDHTLAIVVRYFGGTLLGTAGLLKAYQSAVKEAINNAKLVTPKLVSIYRISFDYSYTNKIDYLLKDSTILKKEYQQQVIYDYYSDTDLSNKLNEITAGQITIVKLEDKVVEM